MTTRPIGILDYGVGNLYNLQRSVRAAGFSATIISQPEQVLACDYLLLPGVGAFGDGIQKMRQAHVDEAVRAYAASGRPLLGICLGMQLLLSVSYELGTYEGLGLIPGDVRPIPVTDGVMVPHVGWERVVACQARGHKLLSGCQAREEFYFAHSFVCQPKDERVVVAWFGYGPNRFAGILASEENIMGCQFHPEMSSAAGIRILRNFLTC